MKVTPEMLGPKAGSEVVQAPEDREYMSYDLHRLAAFAEVDVDFKKARSPEYLLGLAKEHTQLLMNKIFALPSEPAEVGRLVQLPPPVFKLPREKPLPKPKEMTRWEKFALSKGIVNRKRSATVFDEETQTYKRRWGYDRANDHTKSGDWVIEHKGAFVPGQAADPWAELKKEKKERVEKNKRNQESNIRAVTGGKRKNIPGNLDLASLLGNQRPAKRNQQHKERKVLTHAEVALAVAQKSTNSMGKFDVKRRGEPELKAARIKRQDHVLARPDVARAQQASIMKKVLGKVKESEAIAVNRAAASVGADKVKKGEVVFSKNIEKRHKLREKMSTARKDGDAKRAQTAKARKDTTLKTQKRKARANSK